MDEIIHFKCRGCDAEIAVQPQRMTHVSCPACHNEIEVTVDEELVQNKLVTKCISCGHEDFYVQKDFNRNAGMAIVAVGIALSLYFFSKNQPIWAMGSLGLTALIDALVFFLVGEVTVCYACHAIYRGFRRNAEHEPFDLKKLEKYGGRTPRFGS